MIEWLRQLTPTQEVVVQILPEALRIWAVPLSNKKLTHAHDENENASNTGSVFAGVKAAGHLSKSGIQNPDSTAEQPGQWNVKLLEEQPQKKTWTVTENKEVMMCYFEADSSQRRYKK